MECYRLLTTALVGFEAVGLGPMLDYGRLISTSVRRSVQTGTHGATKARSGTEVR